MVKGDYGVSWRFSAIGLTRRPQAASKKYLHVPSRPPHAEPVGDLGKDYGRAHARAAVEDAINSSEMTPQQFADLAGVFVDTVRDFLNGNTWPRARSLWRMEEALGWPRGRISQIVRNYEVIDDDSPARWPAIVDPELIQALSELSESNRLRVWAEVKDLLEDQRRKQAM